VAMGLEKDICITSLVGYGPKGEVAFETLFKECQPVDPGGS
jgi:hypothetical protein